MTSLDKFNSWSDRNSTHLNRFFSLIHRQVENQRKYVELFKIYPANSTEIRDEIQKLYSELGNLVEEFKETIDDMGQDMLGFQDVLESLKDDWKQNG